MSTNQCSPLKMAATYRCCNSIVLYKPSPMPDTPTTPEFCTNMMMIMATSIITTIAGGMDAMLALQLWSHCNVSILAETSFQFPPQSNSISNHTIHSSNYCTCVSIKCQSDDGWSIMMQMMMLLVMKIMSTASIVQGCDWSEQPLSRLLNDDSSRMQPCPPLISFFKLINFDPKACN